MNSEPVRFPCLSCGRRLKAPLGLVGRTVRCPKCLTAVPVPDPIPVAEDDGPAETIDYRPGMMPGVPTRRPPPPRKRRQGVADDDGEPIRSQSGGTRLHRPVVVVIALFVVLVLGHR
jgi:hypothetical protein